MLALLTALAVPASDPELDNVRSYANIAREAALAAAAPLADERASAAGLIDRWALHLAAGPDVLGAQAYQDGLAALTKARNALVSGDCCDNDGDAGYAQGEYDYGQGLQAEDAGQFMRAYFSYVQAKADYDGAKADYDAALALFEKAADIIIKAGGD